MNLIRRRLRRPAAALAVVFATVVALGAAAPAARAQVLDFVPSGSVVVIKVNNLKAVSDKFAKFSEAVGLSAMQPELADPLASLQENMKIKEGLDSAGEMAFVITKLSEDGEPDEDSMLLLVPVSDYKAFLGNFPDAKTNGDITSNTGEGPDYIANWGKYAAMADSMELLEQKPAGLKLSGLAAKEAKEKDAFLFVNIPALAPMALPAIKDGRTEVLEEIDGELGDDENAKQFAGVAKAAVGQFFTIAEGFMRDATSASISLHLNDAGIQSTWVAEFKPDSYAGKLAAQFKNTDQALVAGLPAGRKYFAAVGMQNAPEVMGKVMGDLLDPISKELAATDKGKSFVAAVDSFKKSMGATQSFVLGYPIPTGEVGKDSVVQVVSVVRGDSKVIADAQRSAMQGMGDLMALMPQEAGQMSFQVTPGGKTVGGVKFDTYKTEIKVDENDPQAAQAQQMMSMLYGPNGQSGVFGPVGPDAFLLVQGGTDKLIEEAVAAAKAPKDAISSLAHVQSVATHLPKQRILVEYVFVDHIVATALRYANAFGMPAQVKLEENLPPIGITGATEGSAVRFDGFVPTKLVQSLVAAGMQAFMGMQGGQPGDAGDGL